MTEEAHSGIVPVEEGDEERGRNGENAAAAPPLEERSREEVVELFLRARADLENARRRFRLQREEMRSDATAVLLRELLPQHFQFHRNRFTKPNNWTQRGLSIIFPEIFLQPFPYVLKDFSHCLGTKPFLV